MSHWWKLFSLRDQLKNKKRNHIDKLKKTVCYEVIENGFCVNQNAVK